MVDTVSMSWIIFSVLIILMLALDLGIFQRRMHKIGMKEALLWSGFWIALSLLFNLYVLFVHGPEAGLQFFLGYLLEKSLSLDNIFIFVLIFSYFDVPDKYQHKVLYWGVIGALILRFLFIFGGLELLYLFSWVIYIFGAFLILTGIRMILQKVKIKPEKNILVSIAKKLFRVTDQYHDGKFFIVKQHKLWATRLFLVLLVVEGTDVIFAIDSIPAIFAITTDPFIVYSSNIFALLGLRSLYFVLARSIDKFTYLKYFLGGLLILIGCKMLFF